ncbi:cupin domain-containing protein (plasmid) [Bosea sp. F3-2]|uniref:cupin domain-containing protein n=1 Tax=Bosea sp. F3-2 TaxID=2599640 RepID=UPI0011EC375A|nr:cupin domain-containing protein [Bosea sp. F3-2]QEL27018.1 cupin domain-containing protein [Bosea sp. F3-2]
MHQVSSVPAAPAGPSRHILAGRAQGIESCEIALLRLAAEDSGDVRPGSSEERLIYVLSGAVEISSGEQCVTLRKGHFLFLPRGRSHELRQEGPDNAVVLDIRAFVAGAAAAPPAPTTPLTKLTGQVSPDALVTHQGHLAEGRAFETQTLIDRKRGSERLKVFLAAVQPGSGMGLHIHPFDQFYYMLDGELDLQIGLETGIAAAGQLALFPAGIVHRNRNASSAPALQITINAPEASAGAPSVFDVTLSQPQR